MASYYENRKQKALSFFSRKSRKSGYKHISRRSPIALLFIGLFINLSGARENFSQQLQPSPPSPAVPRSSVFKQEIARLEIIVQRPGKQALPLTQVPRVQAGDILRVRLLEEAISGIKPDQSGFDWTLLVAYINPNKNDDSQKSVSQELRFREKGWYTEHLFIVPYDSQPVIFLYPRPKYRAKILNIVNKNSDDIRKLGEKTIEIAEAYAQINTFLYELQGILKDSRYSSLYNPAPPYPYNYSNPYNPNLNKNLWLNQTVEGLAKSFNIQLPNCWRENSTGSVNYTSTNNSAIQNQQDFVSRTQCVARNVRLEDFDISVTKMWQQGGAFLAAQLVQKYPQFAFWINIAASAIDFMVKTFQKTALRIVPTVISSAEVQASGAASQPPALAAQTPAAANSSPPPAINRITKISLFSESPPSDNEFVTAYPLIVHRWQAEPDPEVISLPEPSLLEPCLHTGLNLLKNTDLSEEWVNDTFTRDFKFVLSAPNAFRKEFALRKNVGLGGWELNILPQDMAAIPKINAMIEAQIVGTRGFNEIKSPEFELPVASGGSWTLTPESQKDFAAGGKRKITLRNPAGTCRCLQSITFKPASGGQFVFEAAGKENNLQFSDDGREASFEIDTSSLKGESGNLELKNYGGETVAIPVKLYPLPPNIADLKIARGDNQATVIGDRLEQIEWIKINGKKAKVLSAVMPYGASGKTQTQRAFTFEDSGAKQLAETASLELGLENERVFQVPQAFASGPAKPTIAAGEAKEIEGIFLANTVNKTDRIFGSQLDLRGLPVFPIGTAKITVNLQSALTDYDFKAENIQIQTRIEKSEAGTEDLAPAAFEVLNWKTMNVSFTLSEQAQKILGGRRLQFRIRDKQRGDSDWYTIKQTFIRIPKIDFVKCAKEMNGQCEIKGENLEYVGQLSTDGGKTWFPSEPNGLKIEQAGNGQKSALIPLLADKKMLQIRLIDFPGSGGLPVSGYVFYKAPGIVKVQANLLKAN